MALRGDDVEEVLDERGTADGMRSALGAWRRAGGFQRTRLLPRVSPSHSVDVPPRAERTGVWSLWGQVSLG